jgi:hypothetical protein
MSSDHNATLCVKRVYLGHFCSAVSKLRIIIWKRLCSNHSARTDPIRPCFLGTVPQMSRVPGHKNTFLTTRTNILTFPRWETAYGSMRSINRPLAGRNRRGSGRRVCCLLIIVRTETAQDEGQVCEEKSVSELSVWVWVVLLLVCCFMYRYVKVLNELSCNIVRFGCFLLRNVLHRTAGFGEDLKFQSGNLIWTSCLAHSYLVFTA